MKKTIRSTMMSTIAVLVVAVLTLTGATYAWFSAANTAKVTSVTVNVDDTAGGVLIATEWGDWVSEVEIPQLPEKLIPVSTVKALDANGDLTFYGATMDNTDPDRLKIDTAKATGGYIAFPLYFMNDGATSITLTMKQSSITAAGGANDDIDKAVRMAVVDFGDQAISAEGGVNGSDKFTKPNDASAIFIYEPNATEHTTNGLNDGASGKTLYYGIKAAADGINRKDGANDTTNLELVETAETLNDYTITVAAGNYHKIVVYVWVEGQDADCQNDVSGEALTVALQFDKVTA